jgi:tetratricopeptide (TPR) repeat protein
MRLLRLRGGRLADTEQENKFEKALERLAQQQQQLLEKQESLLKQISENQKPLRKDIWDRLGAIAPILSGTIIALGGTYFTLAYNQQQLKLQEAQTIERFIPHLLGDEKSKRAAILAISSLTDAKMAAKVASIFASPGTVSALESIAENDTSGDRKALKGALAKALDNMAETYRMDKRYEDAIATYKKALDLQEQTSGKNSIQLVPNLNRIAELYAIHKDFDSAETLLKRASDIQKSGFGADSMQFAAQLRRLADLYKEQGLDAKSQSVMNQAVAIEQKLPATAGSGVKSAEQRTEGELGVPITGAPEHSAREELSEPKIYTVVPEGNKPAESAPRNSERSNSESAITVPARAIELKETDPGKTETAANEAVLREGAEKTH